MPKNIVICCDGTSNEFDGDRTNVVKLYQMLVHDPKVQVTYYNPGLGTMEAAGALTAFSRWWTKHAGFAFGYGLANNIRDAYVFLMNHYEKGDKVFLFGFSRGAYTVRAVASLLHMVGLIRPGNEPLVPYAVRMMKNAGRSGGSKQFTRALMVSQQFKLTFSSVACRPLFRRRVGHGELRRLDRQSAAPALHHAQPVDRSRPPRRSPSTNAAPSSAKISGVRKTATRPARKTCSKSGFPAPTATSAAAIPKATAAWRKSTLEWMLREAQAEGLLTIPEREARIMGRAGGNYVKPDATAPIHNSLTGFLWRAHATASRRSDGNARTVDGKETWIQRRRFSLSGRRKIPAGAHIHEAAFARDEAYTAKLPPDAIRVTTLAAPTADPRYTQEPKKARA